MPDPDAELRRMQRPFTPAYYRADLGPRREDGTPYNLPPAYYCLTESIARSWFPSWPYDVVRLRVEEDDA
jgi:hypothetical protein